MKQTKETKTVEMSEPENTDLCITASLILKLKLWFTTSALQPKKLKKICLCALAQGA